MLMLEIVLFNYLAMLKNWSLDLGYGTALSAYLHLKALKLEVWYWVTSSWKKTELFASLEVETTNLSCMLNSFYFELRRIIMWVIRTKRERRRKEVERERFEEGYRVALSSLAHIYIRVFAMTKRISLC